MMAAPGMAPRVLLLPGGALVSGYMSRDDGLVVALTGTDQHVELHGAPAHRMARLLAGTPRPDDRAALRALLAPWARAHPWLMELLEAASGQGRLEDRANASAEALILGDGLGMLFIEVTDRCNERCIHCYAEAAPECANRLSLDEMGRVLIAARRLGRPAVQFTGGDPLIHPDIVAAVAMARDMGFDTIELYTNGLALNDAMLERLAPHRPRLAFSVYSHDDATHDAITRVPGSLQRTLRAMRRARAAGLTVRAGIIVMPENRGHEAATIRMLRDMGLEARDIGVDVVRSAGRGRFMGDYAPETAELESNNAGHRPTERGHDDSRGEAAEPGRRGKLCVTANGDVHPCIFSREITLGNIREAPLDAIVRGFRVRTPARPSAARWAACRGALSCADCQAIAYALGAGAGPERQTAGAEHAVA